MQPVFAAREQPRQERHVALGQPPLEHGPGEAVDLHDEEPAPTRLGRAPQPETTDEPVEPTLETQYEVV
jgi:hypothetical protein